MAANPNPPQPVTNAPVYSIITIALFLASMTVIIVTGHTGDGGLLIGLGISTLPSLVASVYAERTARDVRNGVVQEKARQGASEAIQEHKVVTRDGPGMTLAMESLAELLAEKRNNENDG